MEEPAVIAVAERLDRSAVEGVVRDLDRALAKRPGRVVLDLAKVQSFDSAGMGAIMESMRKAKAAGVELTSQRSAAAPQIMCARRAHSEMR